jgi:4-carboxymuconolactone decarboxylase
MEQVMSEPTISARQLIGDIAPKLAELSDDLLFGDIWERAPLSKRDRSIITVAVITALYRTNEMPFHIERALSNGVTREEVIELFTHLAFYAGWPSAMTGVRIAQQVFAKQERGS